MNQQIYELLLPLKPKWEIFKNERHSLFTNQEYAIVQEAWSMMFGAPPRNLGCQSCVQELITRTFIQFDNFIPVEPKRKRNAKV
jgi:hypothetical protein